MGSPKPRRTRSLASEDEIVQSIRGILGNGIEAFGMRDDAAVLGLPAGPLVVSVDSVVGGVHVDLDLCSPADVGWKALMGALSDLAAMGASPVGAVVALCVPAGSGSGSGSGEMAFGVMEGVAEASSAGGCPVVGGDVSEAGELTVAVTVLGTVADGPPVVPRSRARPGDVVLVTGPCGGSAAGLRMLRTMRACGGDASGDPQASASEVSEVSDAVRDYRRPVARLREGELARLGGATAMIDVSDGLALDLHRLADASGVGFLLEHIPVAAGATLEEALGGGEDYELLVVADREAARSLSTQLVGEGLRPLLLLGTIVDDPAARLLRGQELARLGWQHRLG